MVRSVGSVIVGYVAMFIFVFVTFSIAYVSMGTEGAFQEGSYEVSAQWIVVSFALGLIAAIVGGVVCAAIARGPKAPVALAVVVLLLGLLMAVPVLTATDQEQPEARGADVGNLDAMQKAKQPGWVALANPFVGAFGVLFGSRMTGGGRKDW